MTILKILLAIFLPPIAAFMQVGLTKHFFINLILSFFAILPGSIHALWLIVNHKKG